VSCKTFEPLWSRWIDTNIFKSLVGWKIFTTFYTDWLLPPLPQMTLSWRNIPLYQKIFNLYTAFLTFVKEKGNEMCRFKLEECAMQKDFGNGMRLVKAAFPFLSTISWKYVQNLITNISFDRTPYSFIWQPRQHSEHSHLFVSLAQDDCVSSLNYSVYHVAKIK